MRYRNRFGSSNRFDNYRSMTAKYAGQCSVGESCTAKIAKGDHIGYNASNRKVCCVDCWRKWCNENAEAAQHEARYPQCCDSFEMG